MLKIIEQIKEKAFQDELQKIATPVGFKKAMLLKSCTAKDMEKEATPRPISIGIAGDNRLKEMLRKKLISPEAAARVSSKIKKLVYPVNNVVEAGPVSKLGLPTSLSKRRGELKSLVNDVQTMTRQSKNVMGDIVRGPRLGRSNVSSMDYGQMSSSGSHVPYTTA